MRKDFITAIQKNQTMFGLNMMSEMIESLADFYEFIQEHNRFLHLVGPASATEFAVRHILESLTLLEFLPENAGLADIGPGAGLPSVPCLMVRPDLKAFLIESKLKKAGFLDEVVAKFGLENRAQVLARQFEEVEKPSVSHITCRALDKFTKKLPKLLRWSDGSQILFFGGPKLGAELARSNVRCMQKLMPQSEQRFLFIGQN